MEMTVIHPRQRIAILSFSPIYRDARVLRQIEYARREFDVDVVGYGEWPYSWSNVRFTEIKPADRRLIKNLGRAFFLLAGMAFSPMWEKSYWRKSDNQIAKAILDRKDYALIHANDLIALPIAIEVSRRSGAKVLFDAHEYYLGQEKKFAIGEKIRLAYLKYLLEKYGSQADKVVTVSEGIVDIYRDILQIQADVIVNAPKRLELDVQPVDPDNIKLIHHGIISTGRKPEYLIEMMIHLDERFSLYLMLIDERGEYLKKIKDLAKEINPERVHFIDPVAPEEIVPTISKFDIGVYILPANCINHELALPNKFFDFIAAGLAVGIGPSPEMVRIVSKYRLGVVAEAFEPEELAAELNRLSVEEINQMKRKAYQASEELNADVEMRKLLNIYHELIGR